MRKRVLALVFPAALAAGCAFDGSDSRLGGQYFQPGRSNAATAADLERFLGLPVDHRTATARMRTLGARCETSEVLMRIDDAVLCRYANAQSFFENKIWSVRLDVDDNLMVYGVRVDSWLSSTLPSPT